MTLTIFFSWQADRPTKEGRNLIERALEAAVGRISQDATVEEATRELSIDRDTRGVPGSPPIVETIFKKIDRAAIFVPDLTFVAQRHDGRPSPNPNVLIEYGWALKTLGHSRILPVMNIAYGAPTSGNMPFDLAHLRHPITYACPEGASDDDRKAARIALAKDLENGIRTYVQSEEFLTSSLKAAEPRPFARREPRNGQGRFRSAGEPLGTSDGPFGITVKEIRLADGTAMWLRVMPSVEPERLWYVTELEAATSPQRGGKLLLPLTHRHSSYDFIRAEDGFGCYGIQKDEALTSATTFVFTTGEVWGIDSAVLDLGDMHERRVIPNVADVFSSALTEYSEFLSRLGVTGPFKWIAGMENLKGRSLAIIPPPQGALTFPIQGSCVTDVVAAEGIHANGDPPLSSLHPFFALLYDRCGIRLPEWFGDNLTAKR